MTRVRTDPPVVVRVGTATAASTARPAAGGAPAALVAIPTEGDIFSGDTEMLEPFIANLYGRRTNGGEGILVIGAGKLVLPFFKDLVSVFWLTISANLDIPVTLVHGASAITAQSFDGFAMIAVASIAASGGILETELAALYGRAGDLGAWRAGGGVLLGGAVPTTSVIGYRYAGDISVHVIPAPDRTDTATVTPLGAAMDLPPSPRRFWLESFLTWPGEFAPLATTDDGPVGIGSIGGAPARDTATAANPSARVRAH